MAALINCSMAGSVGSPNFIYLGITFLDHLDQQITDPFLQTHNLINAKNTE